MTRPWWITAIDASALGAYAVALSLRLSALEASLWQAFAGYLLADAISGLTHWFADSKFNESTAVIGKVLIQPFRHHHRDPLALTRHGLLELCGNSALCSLPLFLLPLPATLIATMTLALVLTNVFHKWAHEDNPPAIARWLQRWRLILTPEQHARHHTQGREAYCVTSGWFNPILDRLTHAR
jgi:ubiquitin-conjugating enzyme E2 variant